VRFLFTALIGFFLSLSPAWAQQSVTVLSTGPLLADGQTESTIQLLVPGVTSRSRVKVKSRGGSVVSQHVDDQGIITLGLLPKAVAAQSQMNLSLQVRGAFKLNKQVPLLLRPAPVGPLTLQVEPQQLRPGQTEATVSVRVPERGHLSQDARKIALSASTGKVSGLRYVGNGVWTATYSAPKNLRKPVAALITAVDLTAPERVAGKVQLPIRVNRSQTFTGPPGGRVVVMDGNKEYGPSLVSPAGTVAFDMDLLPGATTVEVSTSARGQQTQKRKEVIQVESDPQIVFVALPDGLKVPLGRHLRILMAYGGELSQDPSAQIRVTGPGHPALKPLGGGWFEVQLNTPREPGAFELSAHLGEHRIRLKAEAVTGVPTLSASTNPPNLTDKKSLTMTVLARDEQGVALPGQKIGVHVMGGKLSGRVRDARDGSYTQRVIATNSQPVTLVPYATVAGASLPPARLRFWSGLPTTQVSNVGSTPVFVVLEDAMGLPVRNVEVLLQGPTGAEIASRINTGSSGIAFAEFRSGSLNVGPAMIRAQAQNLYSDQAIWVLPAQGVLQKPVRLGSPWERASIDRWRAGLPVTVVRERVAVAVAAPPVQNPEAVNPPSGVTSPPSPPPLSGMSDPFAPPMVETGSAYIDQTEVPFLQARVGFSTTGISFQQTHESNDNSVIPSSASYARGLAKGVLGIKARALARVWDDKLHVELDARWGQYSLKTGLCEADDGGDCTTESHGLKGLLAGAKYRHPVEGVVPFFVEGGLWLYQTDIVSFEYNESRTGALQKGHSMTGARLGAGLSTQAGPISVDFMLAETFAPAPVDTSLGLGVDMPLEFLDFNGRPISVRLDWAMEFRHANLELNGIEVMLRDKLQVLSLSAGLDL